MDVILDANIFRSDFLLRSKDFEILLNYLDKSESKLILPEIILDEIRGLYSSIQNERIKDVEKASRNLNLMLTDKKDEIKVKKTNVSENLKKYEEYIRKKLSIKEQQIIPYKNDYLPEISKRAINRIKPAGDKGQGFRDTLIWLTLKDYCKSCEGKQLTFISNNTDDFANKEKNDLDDLLIDECKEDYIFIYYYKNLKEFVENESKRLDFYNEKWILENIELEDIFNLAIDDLNGRERGTITSWFQRETGNACLGYNVTRMDTVEIYDPTVYEMAIDKSIVNICIHVEIEVEFEFEYLSNDYDDRNFEQGWGYSTSTKYTTGRLYISVTIEDEKITDTELTDIDF